MLKQIWLKCCTPLDAQEWFNAWHLYTAANTGILRVFELFFQDFFFRFFFSVFSFFYFLGIFSEILLIYIYKIRFLKFD